MLCSEVEKRERLFRVACGELRGRAEPIVGDATLGIQTAGKIVLD